MSSARHATPWVKAARSGGSGQCVELRRSGGAVEVRDSKDVTGPVLRITPDALTSWVRGARRGELDHLHRS